MPQIRPFAALRYARRPGLEPSSVIAPPFDVLDARSKAALQARNPNNIVTVDLPHLPAKTVGPDEAYQRSAQTLRAWIDSGVLVRDTKPAFYAYAQTYDHGGRSLRRRGFFAVVRLSPFGAGHVVPHELTYREAIEDRLRLMRATHVQLSPIFGLYNDIKNEVTSLLYHDLGVPEVSATLDGVRNDLWTIADTTVENRIIDLMGTRPIYIADGHHRYTTALQYQKEMEEANGGPLPDAHAANYCLFSLISMQDDGLLIHPTHRFIGGIDSFSLETFKARTAADLQVSDVANGNQVSEFARHVLPKRPPHTFGLFDGRTRKLYELSLKNPDVLAKLEPDKSVAWRWLDVAILQRYLLDEVIEPAFAKAGGMIKGYTADPDDIAAQVDGQRFQIALLLQSTPLAALEDLGRHGEVMPQKSTYFFPKLATGMVINPLQ